MAVMSFAIRPLAKTDSDAVLALARSLDDWFNDAGLAQMERDLASHSGFVATDRGRILGFITWRPIESEGADLSWLGVGREFHRTGVGRALLRVLVNRLRDDGVRRLEVSTVADSLDYEPYSRTRAFYRANGFKDFRVDRGFYGEGDDRYDRLVMQLDLEAGEAA